MNTTRSTSAGQPTQGKLTVAHTLAQLLERLERSRVPVGAAQYRAVVQHLLLELESLREAPELGAFLDLYPATSELYENTAYAHAGLCRSPLEFSLQAELRAREAIERVMRRPQPGLTNGQS
ncbi:hypothetical protein [Roseateles toxinivorans]|uniref:Uncharacterized protein n=1 Tax=Roseateles toxinivorans TaxID=270368 RepID=A0A4R6QT11_9BURK|nr:hypothetical protein [Roseateles toxinivorans]TDP74694.1 hypothetical protein DES47_101758 [Roseateles toxinivorans]